jgi:hypothetical protein
MFFGIRDGKKSKSGIRDKHPGSATLILYIKIAVISIYKIKKNTMPKHLLNKY